MIFARAGSLKLAHSFFLWLGFLSTTSFIMSSRMNTPCSHTQAITLTLLDLTKSYKNYLQNTQHVVLRNRPTLPIGTERLACLNSPRGVQLVTLAWHAAGPGFEPWARRARCARFFLHPPFLPPSGDSFFRTFPTKPVKPVVRLGLMNTCPLPLNRQRQTGTCLRCCLQLAAFQHWHANLVLAIIPS